MYVHRNSAVVCPPSTPLHQPRCGERSMEGKYDDEILSNWTKEFYKSDISYERKLRRKSREYLMESVLEDGVNRSENVRPWNYEDYLYRLRTYKSSTWFAKPSIISPLSCARYGWINIGSDKLKCESCNKEITHERGDYTGEEFAQKLITSHDPLSCGWINDDHQSSTSYNFSPESFLYFPIQTLDVRLNIFHSRFMSWYHQLVTTPVQIQIPREILKWIQFSSLLQTSFPSMVPAAESKEEPLPAADDRLGNYIRSLLRNTTSPILDTALLGALFFSLFCWDLSRSQSDSPACASCSMCGRTFPLRSAESPQTVNPSQEHKYYCPVVSSYTPLPISSCREPVPSGYLQVVEAILMHTSDWKITETILQSNPDALPISSFTVDSTKLKRSFGEIFAKTGAASTSGLSPATEAISPENDSIDIKYKKIKNVLSMVPSSRK